MLNFIRIKVYISDIWNSLLLLYIPALVFILKKLPSQFRYGSRQTTKVPFRKIRVRVILQSCIIQEHITPLVGNGGKGLAFQNSGEFVNTKKSQYNETWDLHSRTCLMTLFLITFMCFLKTRRIYYKISEDQFNLQYKIHFTEVNSLTVGMTDSRVSPWWTAFLQTLPLVLLVQL